MDTLPRPPDDQCSPSVPSNNLIRNKKKKFYKFGQIYILTFDFEFKWKSFQLIYKYTYINLRFFLNKVYQEKGEMVNGSLSLLCKKLAQDLFTWYSYQGREKERVESFISSSQVPRLEEQTIIFDSGIVLREKFIAGANYSE